MTRDAWRAAGDDRTDFDLVLVVEHLVFGYEFIAAYDQMRFDHEIEFFEEVFRLLRAFDLNGSCGMTELNLHSPIICRGCVRGQGAFSVQGRVQCVVSKRVNFVDHCKKEY